MKKTMLALLTHRLSIASVNALLLLLLVQGTWDVLAGYADIAANQHAMEEILESLGTILVAFGVALEERESLMRFMGLYPERHTRLEATVDHHCHYYGMTLLLVGLFMEVAVFIVRMPDLNTVDFDAVLLGLAAVLNVGGALLLARLSWLLVRPGELVEGTA